MDAEMARMNICRDKPAAERVARQFGLAIEEIDAGLVWLIRKTVKSLTFCARLDLAQYDVAPPSLSFCNSDNPSERGRNWWPKTTNPQSNVITSSTGITGNCVVGFAEYYVYHATATKKRNDWRLPVLIRYIGQLLEEDFVKGKGV